MINLKLGPSINSNDPIELNEALQQQQYFLENGNIVQKHTSLIYSRGVLIFYVDRRANIINTINSMSPLSMLNIPSAVSGFERLNDREVHATEEITLRNDLYKLRSVVLSEVNNNSKESNLVIGSSTLVMIPVDHEKGIHTPQHLQYDPYAVVNGGVVNGVATKNDPIVQIPSASSTDEDNFRDMSRKRGIIFIYQLTNDSTGGKISV
jgi:hypothetical protein